MSDYFAPLKDMQFVIDEIAGLESIAGLPIFEEATPELVEAVLEQAGILANEVFSPLNQPGDEHGTRLENGDVPQVSQWDLELRLSERPPTTETTSRKRFDHRPEGHLRASGRRG